MRHSDSHDTLGTAKVKLDGGGGFIMPIEFRKALGLKQGDEIVISWKDGELCITKSGGRKLPKRRRARR